MKKFKLLAGAICLSLGMATANADNIGLTIEGLHEGIFPVPSSSPETYMFLVRNNSTTNTFAVTDKWIRHGGNLNAVFANPQEGECTDSIAPKQICVVTISVSDNVVNDTGTFNLMLKGTQDGSEAAYNSNPIPYRVYN